MSVFINEDDFEEINPAVSLIESVRSIGYDLNTAIADLIDNSVTANATNILIHLEWNNKDPFVAISDDGDGMRPEDFSKNVGFGFIDPNAERRKKDLGRFGLGLKTASLSIARQLCVFSKAEGELLGYRAWDLDIVEKTGRWLISTKIPNWYGDLPEELSIGTSGTLVLWKQCDRLKGLASTKQSFFKGIEDLKSYLGAIFCRFLKGKDCIKIIVNGEVVKAWDPICDGSRSLTQQYFGSVNATAYIIPHEATFLNKDKFLEAAGRKGWSAQQGFYVYREDRLIVNGGWLGLNFKNDEHTKLVRIVINIDSSLDSQWQINVLKSKAIIPSGQTRVLLESMAKSARKDAEELYRRKGKIVTRIAGMPDLFVWQIIKRDDQQKQFSINKDHPLIKLVKENYSGKKSDIDQLLKLIEKTLPAEAIQIEQNSRELAFEILSFDETLEMARESLKLQSLIGKTRKMALDDLLRFEPFSTYKDALLEAL